MTTRIVKAWSGDQVVPTHPSGPPDGEPSQSRPVPRRRRRPHVLLAACGCVAASEFGHLCHCFNEWAEVKAVASHASMHFINRNSLPRNMSFFTEQSQWFAWRWLGYEILHVELRRWADILVIAPLSANTLAKIAGGVCDNLLTCIVRAWDSSKPVFIAPSMNLDMWNNPFTERHLMGMDELGMTLIRPDSNTAAMAEPSHIFSTVVPSSQSQPVLRRPNVLLAACGCVAAALEFGRLCHFFNEWAEVKAVASVAAMQFVNRNSLPHNVRLYTDRFEWFAWRRLGDCIVNIELRRWADIFVIAPLSANTLAKIAGGVCDNLLTCIVRAWDYSKPLFIAPSMNLDMRNNPFTERHLMNWE